MDREPSPPQDVELQPDKFAPQQERSREARRRIMAAAESVLRETGIDGFSMAAVAASAEMPVGNIYRRFAGKEELLQAVKDVVSRRIKTGIAESLACNSHDGLVVFFEVFGEAVAAAFSRDEQLNRALYDPRLTDPALVKSGQMARTSIYQIFEQGITTYLEDVDIENRTLVGKVAFSIVMNAAAFKVRDNDPISSTIEWEELGREFGKAAALYVKSQVPSA